MHLSNAVVLFLRDRHHRAFHLADVSVGVWPHRKTLAQYLACRQLVAAVSRRPSRVNVMLLAVFEREIQLQQQRLRCQYLYFSTNKASKLMRCPSRVHVMLLAVFARQIQLQHS